MQRNGTMYLGVMIVMLALFSNERSPAGRPELSEGVVRDGSNAVLSIANFVKIQQFILKHGKRKTYCQRYGNNHYWPFTEFNAFLNPPDQRNINCEIGKSEFNILVIQVASPGPNRYWDIHLDKAKKELRVQQHYSKTESKVLIQEATNFFKKALAEIDKENVKVESQKASDGR